MDIVEWAEANDRVAELVKSAYEDRPNSEAFRKLHDDVASGDAFSPRVTGQSIRRRLRWPRIKIALGVAITFAVSIGFTVVLVFKKVPSEPATREVVVPVALALADPVSPQSIPDEKRGIVELPPRHRLVFVSATAEKWTDDRLDNLEKKMLAGGYEVDLTVLIDKFNELGRNPDAFITWLEQQHARLVQLGYASERSLDDSPLFQFAVRSWVRNTVIPLVSDPSRLIEGRRYRVEVNHNFLDLLSSPIAFWKRLVVTQTLNNETKLEQLLGPYYDVTAPDQALPPRPNDGHPCPFANHGSLVGGVMVTTRPSGPLMVRTGSALPFSKIGDTIENTSNERAFVRLGINDRIPEDNGSGFAIVTYKIEKMTP